jgi:hypothetical protein
VWFFVWPAVPAQAALPADLQEAARTTLVEVLGRAERAFPVGISGKVVVYHVPGSTDSARLAEDFTAFVTNELGLERPVSVLSARELASRMEAMYMDPSDLRDGDKRAAFYKTPRAQDLGWVVLLSHEIRSQEMFLGIRLEQVSEAGASTSYENRFDKTDPMYAYLGEPVPRTLFVQAPSRAKVYVDGQYLGIAGDDPLSARLMAGGHDVKVSLAGYASSEHRIHISERQDLTLDFEAKDNSGAPFKSFLLGAIVPGLSAKKYGSPISESGKHEGSSDSFVAASAGLFYVGLGIWGIDHFRSVDYLTTGSEDRDKTIKTVELGIALTGYVLNLIGSIKLGREYAANNRELVLRSEKPGSDLSGVRMRDSSVSLAWIRGPDGPIPALSFATSF